MSLILSEAEHLFVYLMVTDIHFSMNCLFMSLGLFFYWLICSYRFLEVVYMLG